MLKLYFFAILTFLALPSFSQQRCATEERHSFFHIRTPKDPSFEQWIREKVREKKMRNSAFSQSRLLEQLYTVPVVVHVIHRGEPVGVGSNIPDEQIFSQMEALNEDFRRRNVDTVNTPDIFKPVAADVGINFVLAKTDPFGGKTNGIVRVMSEKTSWSYYTDEALLKSISYWPAEDYINIWVVNELSGNWIAYSTYPVSNLPGITEPNYNRLNDGIVISRLYFGSNEKGDFDLDRSYDKGRSLTHEMGHYLGLRHIWGDGPCEVDDYCYDTPPANASHNNCPTGISIQCGFESMFQNYMDYTPDRCMNLFTECQKERMRTVIENSPRRFSLLNSPGLYAPVEYDLDLALYRIEQPSMITCERFIIPEIVALNPGRQTVDRFKIAFSIESLDPQAVMVHDTVEFTDLALARDQSFPAELNHVNLENGMYRFSARIIEVNGSDDYNLANNAREMTFLISDHADFIPLVERFNGQLSWDNLKWSVLDEDNEQGWDLQYAKAGEDYNIAASINGYEYEKVGERDWLVSPTLDFSFVEDAGLWFKISYAYRERRNDRLSVVASTDCGITFPYVLFEKTGSALSGVQSDERWRPSGAADWTNEYVDLGVLAGRDNVRIAFIWTNGNGNSVYIDDIEFFTTNAEDPLVDIKNDFLLFPNPLSGEEFIIALRLAERQDLEVAIFDAFGRQTAGFTFKNGLNQVFEAPLTLRLPSGVYLVSLKGSKIKKTKRLIVY